MRRGRENGWMRRGGVSEESGIRWKEEETERKEVEVGKARGLERGERKQWRREWVS